MSTTDPIPTPEQEARAKWDLLLLDLEMRAEQVRQLKRYEPWQLLATITTAIVVASSALSAAAFWLAHLITH